MTYTYLIGWKQHDFWYYGVRFAKNCDPSDLWVKYFTSSRRVKTLRKRLGEPDVIEVRRTFKDAESAIAWERKVLTRLNVKDSKRWLNCGVFEQYVNKGGYELTEEQKARRRGKTAWNKGRPNTEEHRKKQSEAQMGRTPWNKGIPRPIELCEAHSKAMSGEGNPMYGKSAVRGRIWYTNGQENVLLAPDAMPPPGYEPGRYSPWRRSPN